MESKVETATCINCTDQADNYAETAGYYNSKSFWDYNNSEHQPYPPDRQVIRLIREVHAVPILGQALCRRCGGAPGKQCAINLFPRREHAFHLGRHLCREIDVRRKSSDVP